MDAEPTGMVLEHAVLPIRPGQEAAFEAAMRTAQPLIAGMPGFGWISVSRGVEDPSRYLLLVAWESVEAHEQGFRRSPEYQRWQDLLHGFYHPFPTVEHFVPLESALGPAGEGRQDVPAHQAAERPDQPPVGAEAPPGGGVGRLAEGDRLDQGPLPGDG